ncbi:MAG: bifunctional oligoribonuclease/PAP phosphatase NrnA [Lachnospiraceae bacterium]|nr:bifunctional oligoribonuclease/PAP phosphatase NrnA [Lachnospiraceae bacterium]
MTLDIYEAVKEARTIGITGHIKPDGDCIGSCLALLAYLRKRLPEAVVELFLEAPEFSFDHIPLRDQIISDHPAREPFDVFIVCDTNYERTGDAKEYFDKAKKTINIDHHVSNAEGTGQICHVVPEAAACAEIIFDCIDPAYMDQDIAELLYMGIAHDTGVFHFSNTTPQTMRIAAELMRYPFDFSKMLDDTFFARSHMTNQMLAHAILESRFFFDRRLIIGYTDWKRMREIGATRDDTGGIVERLRITKDVECAIYIYEKKPGQWKASLRSSSDLVNVAKVGEAFGGGGHARASGCERNGDLEAFISALVEEVGKQVEAK